MSKIIGTLLQFAGGVAFIYGAYALAPWLGWVIGGLWASLVGYVLYADADEAS